MLKRIITKKDVKGESSIKNANISASGEVGKVSEVGENRSPDGVVKISTTYDQDKAVKDRFGAIQTSGKEYNACTNNCSSFVQEGLRAIYPTFNAGQTATPSERAKLIYGGKPITGVVAPNNLYNAALQIKGSSNIKGPASVEAKPCLDYFRKR